MLLGAGQGFFGILGPYRTLLSITRYGKREGLSNLAIKKVHDTATAFQMRTDMSVHENVPDYEDDYLDKHLKGHTRQRVLPGPQVVELPEA